jgi:hypothetical protein
MSVSVYAPGISVDVFNVLPSTGLGTITQYPLPASTGSVFGVNYYGFAFRSNGSSKQADMCYCPLTDRIYTQGGDVLGSATDGTWSFKTDFSDIRLEVGHPIFPTLPAPHALQDDFGYAWVPSKNQLLLWPGSYFAYENPGAPILNYTGGAWWYDPVAKTYTQDTGYFKNLPYNGVSPGITGTTTGCLFGGVYDAQTNAAFWFNDQAFLVKSLNVSTMTLRPDKNIPLIPPPPGHPTFKGVYFMRTRPVLIGRIIYVMGYWTDGTTAKLPGFWSWNIDTSTWSSLPPAPVVMATDLEMVLNTSKGKVVWIKIDGPDGVVKGIYVFDPATNAWAQDTITIPPSFMGNVSCSLSDGRIAFSGGVFGPQQTMFNFYQLN